MISLATLSDAFQKLSDTLKTCVGWVLQDSLIPDAEFSFYKWLGPGAYGILIVFVIALELLFPLERRKFDKRSVLTGVYFLLSFKIAFFVVVVVPLIRSLFLQFNLPSLHLDLVLPLPVYMLVGLLVVTFVDYWAHRWLHEFRPLWHIHKIHHAPSNMNWATRYHQHFGMQILHAPLVTLTALFLGTELVSPFGVIMMTIDYFQHANVRFRFGPLNYIISTPEIHRVHHSANPMHYSKNYGGSFVLWDMIFGTYHYDPKNPPTEFGLSEPIPEGFVRQQVYPLIWIARDGWASLSSLFRKRAAEPGQETGGEAG